MKQEHNEADEGGHSLPVSIFVSRQARQGASAGFNGCRGAALTQSRSDSGVYTDLIQQLSYIAVKSRTNKKPRKSRAVI